MGMVAILVSELQPFWLSFVPSPVASEKSFEILKTFPIQMYRARTNA